MFAFLRREVNIIDRGWLEGMSELHCHLLPGVDDGVKDTAESLELMRMMRRMGIVRIGLSPHIFALYPKNNAHTLQEVYKQLAPLYAQEGMPCYLGAEYMMDEHFTERLQEPLLTIGTSNHLLVETSFAAPSYHFIEHLFLPFTYGATPVLAHPERFLFLSMEEYDQIKDKGCKLQLNLFSLSGMYSEAVKKRAAILIEKGYYDFVGTDLHRPSVLKRHKEKALMPRKYETAIRSLIQNNDTLFIS